MSFSDIVINVRVSERRESFMLLKLFWKVVRDFFESRSIVSLVVKWLVRIYSLTVKLVSKPKITLLVHWVLTSISVCDKKNHPTGLLSGTLIYSLDHSIKSSSTWIRICCLFLKHSTELQFIWSRAWNLRSSLQPPAAFNRFTTILTF